VAQTKKKRRRKHRGTQGGGISTRPQGRPRNRAEARQRAQQRRSGGGGKTKSRAPTRGIVAPSWASAFRKGLVAGGLFFVLLALLFKEPVGQSAALAAFMLVFYVPMGYVTDRFFYQRALRKEQRERQARQQGNGS
jgi:hypothetical protein